MSACKKIAAVLVLVCCGMLASGCEGLDDGSTWEDDEGALDEDSIGSAVLRLNAQYSSDPTSAWSTKNGHNWLVSRAFSFFQEGELSDAMLPHLPAGLSERDVQYGVAFADNPWFGRPETFDATHPAGTRVPSIREDLWSRTLGTDCNGVGGTCLEVRYPWSTTERPNLHLHTRWVLGYGFGVSRPCYGADNLMHYSNDRPLTVDGTGSSSGTIAEGPQGVGNLRISATHYGEKLYELARRFWSTNEPMPRLDQLERVSNPGRIAARVWTTGGDDPEEQELPSTYLGGNPFVLTADGRASWPIWVPDTFEVWRLTTVEPPRSKRAAGIYLGWAVHMMHDLAQPYHAMNLTGENHANAETEIGKNIQEGKFNHLPIIENLFFPTAEYTYSDEEVYYPEFWLELYFGKNPCQKFDDHVMLQRYREVVEKAKRHLSDVNDLGAQEYLMDVSLKHTIMMMACLEREIGFDGKVVSSQGAALRDANVTVRSTTGAFSATVKTDSAGAFMVKVPSLGQYVLDVSKAGYQPRSTNRSLYNAGLSEPVISLAPISEPQGGISGHVLSDATGLGIAGAKVCAGSLCATTSTSGYYTLALRPGQHQIEASHPNFFSGLGSADVASSYVNLSFSLFPLGDLDSPSFPDKGFDPLPIQPL